MSANGALGVSPARLRGDDIDRPYHGVRTVGIDLTTVRGRCRAYRPRLRPNEVFSHTTAAVLYGVPLPPDCESETVLHVASDDRSRPRTAGVVGHRIRAMRTVLFDRLPLASPADTWCQLATRLTLEDLVAAGDAFVSGERIARGVRSEPLCTVSDLRAAIDRHPPARGTRRLDEAIGLVRTGVDSRRETLTRLLIVQHGLPEPSVAPPVPVAGGLVLHPDLGYPELRVAVEYEGDEHRADPVRWRDDIARRRALEAVGWRVLRVTIADLRRPEAFLADLAIVLREASAERLAGRTGRPRTRASR